VEVETAKANVEAEKVAVIQVRVEAEAADAQKDLAAAEPAIAEAMRALDTLDKKDLGNCRTMTVPPEGVLEVFDAVLVLMANVMPAVPVGKNKKVRDKDRGWDVVKKVLLGNVNGFIDDLKAFKGNVDEGNVHEVNFKEVRQYLAMEFFNEATIMKKNSAAAGLCAWVINIVNYYDIWRDVEPKRMKLQKSNEMLAEANEQLAKVQTQVDELNAQLARLQTQYDKAEAAKKEAEETAERGKLKLDLASRLIAALGSEGARWTATVRSTARSSSRASGCPSWSTPRAATPSP
jgi:dynein heavy chain